MVGRGRRFLTISPPIKLDGVSTRSSVAGGGNNGESSDAGGKGSLSFRRSGRSGSSMLFASRRGEESRLRNETETEREEGAKKRRAG